MAHRINSGLAEKHRGTGWSRSPGIVSCQDTHVSRRGVWLRRVLAMLAFLVTLSAELHAADEVARIRWSELKKQGKLEAGEVVVGSESSEEVLLVENTEELPLTARLLTLDPPGISSHLYTVRGYVKYAGVEQPGFLEMWNHFPGQGPFFTRTAAESGPMGKLHGASSRREFILPFQSSPETGAPLKLEINLVLPSKGKVWIGPLTVTEFSPEEWGVAMQAKGAWWGPQFGGMIGGTLGAVFGLLGGLIGTLAGMGKARTFCLTLCWGVIGSGVVCLMAGLVALVQKQPWEVHYPLLLTGCLLTAVVGGLLPGIKNKYAQAELRKMEAMDATVGA